MKALKILTITALCAIAAFGRVSAATPPLTGLKLWLKADAITGLSPGDLVSSWPDSSGNSFDAMQATAANQPHYATSVINGKPAVQFQDDGSTVTGNTNIDYLTSALTLNGNSNSVTAIILFRSDNVGVRDTLIQPLGTGTTWLYTETNSLGGGNNFLLWSFASSGSVASDCAYVPGTWAIASLVQDAGAKSLNLYRDGILEGGGNIGLTSSASSGGWLFGANRPKTGNALNGYIAEVLIYEGALDEATRRSAEEYLSAKYALPLRQTLLADTFNTADTFNLDDNFASRQTGSLAPITNTPGYYSTQMSMSDLVGIATNTLKMSRVDAAGDYAVLASPNLNFLAYEVNDSFRVTFDMNATRLGPSGDAWSSFNFRSITTLQGPMGSGLTLLLRPGGLYDFFEGANALTNAAPAPGIGTFRVCLNVVNNVLSATINGIPVQIAPGRYDYTLTNANSGNYMSMEEFVMAGAAPAATTFDNLVVSLPPPEPSTVVLTDNYNTADTTNLNDNLAARQTGTAAPATYATAQNNGATLAIQDNKVKISNPDSTNSVGIFWPEVDFLPLERFGSFRFSCSIKPTVDDPVNMDSWAGVKVREPNPVGGVLDANGLGILIRPTGGWQIFEGSTSIAAGGVGSAAAYNLVIESRTNVAKVIINGVAVLSGHVMPASSNVAGISLISFSGTDGANPVPTGVSATFDDFKYEALGAAVAIPAPTLINPSYSNGTNSFQFSSVAQVAYAVQYKNDLADPSWLNLKNVLGTGGTVTVTDSTGGDARYYRVWLRN